MRLRTSLSLTLLTAAAVAAQSQEAPPAATTSFTGDIGLVSASGNTRLRSLSAGDRIIHTNGRWALTQIAAYVYGEAADVASANQLRASLRGDYTFAPRLAAFSSASFERNRFAGFTRRTDEEVGVAWKAIAAARDSASFDLGGVLTQETVVDSGSRSFPAARAATVLKHAFTASSYFVQLAEYIPELQSNGEYRVNTESSLVAPLSSHVGIKISYVIRYDSQPPVGFGTTDRVLTSGIQVSF